MNRLFILIPLLLLFVAHAPAAEYHRVFGIILKIDAPNKFVVSCREVPGFMEAMVMPFTVRNTKELQTLRQGEMVDFTLVVDKDSSYAEDVKVHKYQSAEQEPQEVLRL